jgi:hypothetical protein
MVDITGEVKRTWDMYVIAYSITDVKLERDMNVYRVIATNFFA